MTRTRTVAAQATEQKTNANEGRVEELVQAGYVEYDLVGQAKQCFEQAETGELDELSQIASDYAYAAGSLLTAARREPSEADQYARLHDAQTALRRALSYWDLLERAGNKFRRDEDEPPF